MLAKQICRSYYPFRSLKSQVPLRFMMISTRSLSHASRLTQPRQFPSNGFETIDSSFKIEEERLPFYKPEDYYPMRIGEVLKHRYQVVAKLGYGTSSTVWLARDLKEQSYWALKVCTNTLTHNQELKVYQHLATIDSEHPGREYVRRLEYSFKLNGPVGEHDVLVMTPLGMSLRTLQEKQKDRKFDQGLVVRALDQVLLGLAFLHDAHVIHTDLHSDNLLIAMTDHSVLATVEENEMDRPSARKQTLTTTTYVSQYMLGGVGPLTISDMGQARIGDKCRGPAMPVSYRAPEVILNMEWGSPVDAWSVGLLAWELIEGESLFRVYDHESEDLNNAHHLAAMTAFLGPPPSEFLTRSEEARKYWREDGQWRGPVPLPSENTFEALASTLVDKDKDMFLNFVQCFVSWLPEERLNALQGYFHPWLRGNTE